MPMQKPVFDNRTALVTGAAGSLGRAITLGLRDRGCRMVALDRNEAALGSLASEHGVAMAVCDLLDADATERCILETWARHGPISVLVNAVGHIHSAPLVNVA